MKTEITKDLANKKLHITRIFDAPRNMVWKAWTEPEWLDRWWAPLPYQTKTKSMDFKEGGFWLYYMLSPEGDKHWCRLDYLTIFKNDYYTSKDAFCDETGIANTDVPVMHWKNSFLAQKEQTKVVVVITFHQEEDIAKIIEMGFSEEFTSAHGNLDDLLSKATRTQIQ